MNAHASISYEDRLKADYLARRRRLGFGLAKKPEGNKPAPLTGLYDAAPYQAAVFASQCPLWRVENIYFDEHVKADRALRPLQPKVEFRNAKRTARQIKRDVASWFEDVTVEEMEGPSRKVNAVAPRQIAMWLMKKEIGLSYPRIGLHFGRRDHTTVMHACTRVQAFMDHNGGDIKRLADYGKQFSRREVIADILGGMSRNDICSKHGITRQQCQMVRQAVRRAHQI